MSRLHTRKIFASPTIKDRSLCVGVGLERKGGTINKRSEWNNRFAVCARCFGGVYCCLSLPCMCGVSLARMRCLCLRRMRGASLSCALRRFRIILSHVGADMQVGARGMGRRGKGGTGLGEEEHKKVADEGEKRTHPSRLRLGF